MKLEPASESASCLEVDGKASRSDQNTPVAAGLQTNEVAVFDRLKRGDRGLWLETADKLCRVLNLVLQKPVQWRQRGDCWVLEIGGKVVAEVQRDDNGEWRWVSTLAEHGLPPGSGRATSRRDAQKKAWPK